MTVFEYLDFFGAAYGLSPGRRSATIADVLALTDMDGRKNDLINGLSRGMQQRVNLARVLVNDPDLLLLDEPASGLDPRARIELMEMLRELKRMGKTIFISSHILSELAELCDSVTIIDRGLVKYSGTMNDLLNQEDQALQQSFRLIIAEDAPDAEGQIAGLPGVHGVEKTAGRPEFRLTIDSAATDANTLLRGILDLGHSITAFSKDKKHLNQVFMDLTERGVR
jgi:ABC-2 type transport system ATP-binding protein